MKLCEIITRSEFDQRATEIGTLPSIFDRANLGIGRKRTVKPMTVVVKDTKTGIVYGRRTLFQKDNSTAIVSLPSDDPKYSDVKSR